jgi:hypothetical protein
MSTRALTWMISLPCLVVLYFILMVCLWDYRIWVGISLLLLIFIVVGVWLRGLITEQNLRLYRFNHKTETPLDQYGEPTVLRPDMRENSHHSNPHYYQGYRQQIGVKEWN